MVVAIIQQVVQFLILLCMSLFFLEYRSEVPCVCGVQRGDLPSPPCTEQTTFNKRRSSQRDVLRTRNERATSHLRWVTHEINASSSSCLVDTQVARITSAPVFLRDRLVRAC